MSRGRDPRAVLPRPSAILFGRRAAGSDSARSCSRITGHRGSADGLACRSVGLPSALAAHLPRRTCTISRCWRCARGRSGPAAAHARPRLSRPRPVRVGRDWRHYDLRVELDDVLQVLIAAGIDRGGLRRHLARGHPDHHGSRREPARAAVRGAVLNDIGPVIEGTGLARASAAMSASCRSRAAIPRP